MAFKIKQGDRRPSFVVALLDNYGEPTEAAVNLTTAGTAYFNMRLGVGGAIKINRGVATITTPATGVVTYAWGASDTDTAGTFQAEIEVLWADGKAETFPNDGYWDVVIADDIA